MMELKEKNLLANVVMQLYKRFITLVKVNSFTFDINVEDLISPQQKTSTEVHPKHRNELCCIWNKVKLGDFGFKLKRIVLVSKQ